MKMTTKVWTTLMALLVLGSVVNSQQGGEKYEYDDPEEDSNDVLSPRDQEPAQTQDRPDFVQTNSTAMTAVIGKNAILTCQVNRADPNFQLMWTMKLDNDHTANDVILFVGNTTIYNKDNKDKYSVNIIKDGEVSALTIRNFQESDAGKYFCSITSTPPSILYFRVKAVKSAAGVDVSAATATSAATPASQSFTSATVLLAVVLQFLHRRQ